MVLPYFSPIFGLVALTALYFLAGTVLLVTAVLTLTAMALAAAMAERRRAEAALEAQKALVEVANRTKDNFLAMLSHELRTPLTDFAGSGEFAERGAKEARGRFGIGNHPA
jgi:signal transduction histidine kinase